MGFDNVVIEFLTLEEVLSYTEWYVEKAAQYGIQVDYTLYMGQKTWIVQLEIIEC